MKVKRLLPWRRTREWKCNVATSTLYNAVIYFATASITSAVCHSSTAGAVMALARWGGGNGGPQFQLGGTTICSWIKDITIFFSWIKDITCLFKWKSREAGPKWGGDIFHWGPRLPWPPVEPPLLNWQEPYACGSLSRSSKPPSRSVSLRKLFKPRREKSCRLQHLSK